MGTGVTVAARISRYPDWQARLRAAVEARAESPFGYGGHDCSLAVCDLLLAVADMPDPGGPWRGRYRTAAGAQRVLRDYLAKTNSFDSWIQPVSAGAIDADQLLRWVAEARGVELGLSRITPCRAQRGDPVVVRGPVAVPAKGGGHKIEEADCLGMIDLSGSGILVAGAFGGWITMTASQAVAAWRVC